MCNKGANQEGAEMRENELIKAALKARENSYSPYSHFKVGAALLCKDGSIYQGCNIENAAYTPTICAERTAIFKAVSDGKRGFQAIAIVGGRENAKELDYCAPCGVCRQVMMEFTDAKEFVILLARSENDYKKFTLEELFPEGFGAEQLK